jgi:hypothetical protein
MSSVPPHFLPGKRKGDWHQICPESKKIAFPGSGKGAILMPGAALPGYVSSNGEQGFKGKTLNSIEKNAKIGENGTKAPRIEATR